MSDSDYDCGGGDNERHATTSITSTHTLTLAYSDTGGGTVYVRVHEHV